MRLCVLQQCPANHRDAGLKKSAFRIVRWLTK
jgi:hypothetical protein